MNSELSPTLNEQAEASTDEHSPAEQLNLLMDEERVKMRDAMTSLSKIATLTVAETYEVEDMGVVFASVFQEQNTDERNRLIQSLGDLARQWEELNATINEVQRATGSLQYMIDPKITRNHKPSWGDPSSRPQMLSASSICTRPQTLSASSICTRPQTLSKNTSVLREHPDCI